MPIPVSPIDFVLIGRRFRSEDIVAEADRLIPIATTDIEHLESRGYGPDQLDQLKDHRSQLSSESADRRNHRGQKKGARKVEVEAIRQGKLLLRSGIALAHSTLVNRPVPRGETEETTREIVQKTSSQIDALSGRIGLDSATLRTKLLSLQKVLGLPELAPNGPRQRTARAEFIAKLEHAIEKLPNMAETKKQLQADAKGMTAELDEIDGRAYYNMKLLAQTGRAWWLENGNPGRAAHYQLTALHAAASTPGEAPVPGPGNAPVVPPPVTP